MDTLKNVIKVNKRKALSGKLSGNEDLSTVASRAHKLVAEQEQKNAIREENGLAATRKTILRAAGDPDKFMRLLDDAFCKELTTLANQPFELLLRISN